MFDFPIYKQEGWDPDKIGNIPYLMLTLGFTTIVFMFEFYLDIRQLNLFRTSKSVPKELQGLIPDDTFHKSCSYGYDKFLFGIIEDLLSFLEGIALVLLGYLPFIWDLAESTSLKLDLLSGARDKSSIIQEMIVTGIFVIFLMLHDTIFNLPFSLYRTFVVEQKHGFNKSTLTLFLRDKLITLALSVSLGAPIISMVVWLVKWGGPYFYFYVWSFLFVVSLVMMTIYPTLIAPLFNKYDKLDSGPVYDAIEDLAKRVSFPLTQIFVVDGSKRSAHSNAYFYGFFKVHLLLLTNTSNCYFSYYYYLVERIHYIVFDEMNDLFCDIKHNLYLMVLCNICRING
jgi:STE24 endopeptidase